MKVHFVWSYRNNRDAENPASFNVHSVKGYSALVEVFAPFTIAPTVDNTGNEQCICKW